MFDMTSSICSQQLPRMHCMVVVTAGLEIVLDSLSTIRFIFPPWPSKPTLTAPGSWQDTCEPPAEPVFGVIGRNGLPGPNLGDVLLSGLAPRFEHEVVPKCTRYYIVIRWSTKERTPGQHDVICWECFRVKYWSKKEQSVLWCRLIVCTVCCDPTENMRVTTSLAWTCHLPLPPADVGRLACGGLTSWSVVIWWSFHETQYVSLWRLFFNALWFKYEYVWQTSTSKLE